MHGPTAGAGQVTVYVPPGRVAPGAIAIVPGWQTPPGRVSAIVTPLHAAPIWFSGPQFDIAPLARTNRSSPPTASTANVIAPSDVSCPLVTTIPTRRGRIASRPTVSTSS